MWLNEVEKKTIIIIIVQFDRSMMIFVKLKGESKYINIDGGEGDKYAEKKQQQQTVTGYR